MDQQDKKLTLYGAGGHCKVVIDILNEMGVPVNSVVDDFPLNSNILNIPLEKPRPIYDCAIITVGNCKIRKEIASKIKVKEFITAIHPLTIVSKFAHIGIGTVIAQGAVIQACASVGDHCIINTKASVGHDVHIDNFVHVASGATICGGSNIGECTWIGAGSVVKQGISIGNNCMIGAGSVVVKDIPDNVVAYGNPCRVVRMNN